MPTDTPTPDEQAAELGVKQCPNGCEFDMLEIGKESQSLLAMLNAPYQFLRCGECGFNSKTDDFMPDLANSQDEAVKNWNAAIERFQQENGND